MATFGLTTAGFIPKDLNSIQADLNASLQKIYGQSIDLSAQGPFGQFSGILSLLYAELWNLGQAIDIALDPDMAAGAQLDTVSALTGTIRKAASLSYVTLTLTGIPGSAITTFTGSVLATKARFDTSAAGTITVNTSWVTLTVTALNARVTNGGNVYLCTTAGTTGASGPTTTSSAYTDGSVVWRYLGAGTGSVDIAAVAENAGPVIALSGTLINIETPTTGVSNIINVYDAGLGTLIETDAILRARRVTELQGQGKAAVQAIRSAVLLTPLVTSAKVFENITDIVDASGNAPHSVEVLVQGATDLVAATAIFQSVAAGINMVGNTSAVVTDTQGFTHTVGFSRPVNKLVYIIINVLADVTVFPATGAAQIMTALTNYGALFAPDKDAVSSSIGAQAFLVPGVLDVTSTLVGLAPTPTLSTTIPIAARELAVLDSSRIIINISYGIP